VYPIRPGKAIMLTAIEDLEVSNFVPVPACLPPWRENPYRLVSLWDMVQFSAQQWFWAGYALESLITDCVLKPGPGDVGIPAGVLHEPISDETKTKAYEWLEHVHKECSGIGLYISAETVSEIRERLVEEEPPPPDWQWLIHQLRGLQKMIRKEMKGKFFLHVTPERMRFWPTMRVQNIFGDAVATAFPSARIDVSEAGICLSLSRGTASVFHLMRVLEIGLTALGAVFRVSLAHTNWAPAIDQIESKIRDMHKDPAWKAFPDCKEQQEFYAQAASHFGILKDAWRNYTAHARGVYTEEKATLIFDNMRDFMQTLATRLHE
jgi:hypothetical protein